MPDADGMPFNELFEVPEKGRIVVIEIRDVEIVDGHLLDELHHGLGSA